MMDENASEAEQAEGTASGSYWPAEQAMRLECLRLANSDRPTKDTVDRAKAFYAFVNGKPAE